MNSFLASEWGLRCVRAWWIRGVTWARSDDEPMPLAQLRPIANRITLGLLPTCLSFGVALFSWIFF